MKIELKPCPFCGSIEIESGEALSQMNGIHYSQAGCKNCGALGPVKPVTTEESTNRNVDSDIAWNTRR